VIDVDGNIGRRRSRGDSYSNLALEVGCDPTKPNSVEFFHTLIRELRFEATQSQRVFATLFHDPSPKGFILRIILRDIDVSVVLLGVFQQLLVAILPSSDGSCHSPLEANRIELFDTIRREARLGLGSLRKLSFFLQVRLSLVFAL
jgi:hypothetical protein